ncbi:MAG: iron-sulfur cluster assembly scaffold protein [Alphaproteobacteria bacterium]|nr:iron-sulfur cluster assembly scaffold protein [Alphaproteobacteria bacterium]
MSQTVTENGLNEVYNRRILELAADIPRIGVLEDADASATAVSKMCGSKVTVYLKMGGGRVSDFSHQVQACALGQASSSVLAAHVVGSTREEVEAARNAMRAMLKEEGAPPTGKWADLEVLQPAREFRNRHESILLTFEATLDAIGQVEAQSAA